MSIISAWQWRLNTKEKTSPTFILKMNDELLAHALTNHYIVSRVAVAKQTFISPPEQNGLLWS